MESIPTLPLLGSNWSELFCHTLPQEAFLCLQQLAFSTYSRMLLTVTSLAHSLLLPVTVDDHVLFLLIA